MNWDLRKAERALARGDRDEARVYAWNALASITPEDLVSLSRLAQELDDKLLVLEIERRGVSGEVGPASLSRAGTIFRASFLAVLATAVIVSEKL